MPPKRRSPVTAADGEGQPEQAAAGSAEHPEVAQDQEPCCPSFDAAARMSAVARVCNTVGILVAMTTVMSALALPAIVWGIPTLPLWVFGRPFGVWLTGWCKKSHPCIVDIIYRLFGTKIVMYGAAPKPEPVYFIANHQHYHDNVTLISAMAARVAGVSGAGLRWMAKRSLMVQPLGWSMYCSGEVMLSRQYDKDQKKIAEAVRGLPAEKTSWLVVFPEGTRINKKTQKSSQAFMKKQGYPELQHLICPRFKGTQDILREGRDTFKAVYDVTIGYKPVAKYLFWRLPAEVHVHIDRLPIETIPEGAKVKEWLLDRWSRKDVLLETFQRNGHFPGQARPLPGSLMRSVWTLSYCTLFVVLVTAGWWRLLRRLLLLSRGRLLSR